MSTLSPYIGRAFYGSFKDLRAVQREASAPILDGLDVIVLSATGSGKTEAVLAPLVDRYLPMMRAAKGCTLLYVTPTRALANDLLRRIELPLDRLGLSVGIRHGERNDLLRAAKPNILITTPESLDVMLVSHESSILDVQAVVLDEIHLTYNTQRGFQLAVLLKRLEAAVGRLLQVIGLSATVADADNIWHFFRPSNQPVVIRAEGAKPLDYRIAQLQNHRELSGLIDVLAEGRDTKILLFANSRRECDRLGVALRDNTILGSDVFIHHSSLARDARLEVEKRFQQASKAICIATSTLELGIDIGDIDLVILYGSPGGWESLLQRVGRGNRRSNKTNVICLVPPEHGSPFLGALGFEALLSQISEGRLEREDPLEVYGAAVQQILSTLLERNGSYYRIADLASLFGPWSHLVRPTIESMLAALTVTDHVRPHGFQNRYGAGDALHRLRDLSLIWGNFPTRTRDVKLMSRGRELGAIPSINLLRLRPGIIISFAGRRWRVSKVGPRAVDLERSTESSTLEIGYSGSKAPLDPANVEEMLRLLEAGVDFRKIIMGSGNRLREVAVRLRQYVRWDQIPMVQNHERYHYFTFAGNVVNSVIARWARLGSFEAGEIALRSEYPIDFSKLPIDPYELRSIASQVMQVPGDLSLFQGLLPPELIERELVDIWLKTPVFARSLERLSRAKVTSVPMSQVIELMSS